jgi:trimethylamine--corrinoid protein Co-methyltransferase
MQSEYVYPSVADRTSPKEWEAMDKPDLIETAVARKHEVLSTHYPRHIADEVDDAIRARLDIKLPKDAIGRS